MATTLISSKMKIEMSRAIPLSLRRLRFVNCAFIALHLPLLVRIHAPAASRQLYKTGHARRRIRERCRNNQGDGNFPDVCRGTAGTGRRRCTRNGWWKWKLRYGRIVTEVGEDWHRNSSREQAGIRRLARRNLRGTSVIYTIF